MTESEFRIQPWAEEDLPLLEKFMGDSAMTENLGGSESPRRSSSARKRYERLPGRRDGPDVQDRRDRSASKSRLDLLSRSRIRNRNDNRRS